MVKLKLIKWVLFISILFPLFLNAQDSPEAVKIDSLSEKEFQKIRKKPGKIKLGIDKKTEKYLRKLSKQEKKLKKKLWKKDSIAARQLFGDIDKQYDLLQNTSGKVSKYSSMYSGHLDTLSTVLKFLDSKALNDPTIQQSLQQLSSLQEKMNATDLIKKQLEKRQKLIKEKFAQLGMVKELKQFQKHVYYYQAQMKEIKSLFEDPSKMEARLVALVMKIPEFKEFFRNNSQLGNMFALPGGNNANASLAGLQTRALVNQSLVNQFGSSSEVTQMLQQNMQSAQGQLNQLKQKLGSYTSGSYGNGDPDVPDFKKNPMKTRPFFKRLEFGANFQAQRARFFYPNMADIGLSIGYKLSEKNVIGVGISYKAGLGRGWDNISITHQGISLRSFADFRIKGSLFITAGYERHYRSEIRSIEQLKGHSGWQESGLVGLAKKYKINKKLKGEMKLMWDFLAGSQIPRTQAIIFRIGYSLK